LPDRAPPSEAVAVTLLKEPVEPAHDCTKPTPSINKDGTT
jgi:hypothetical protein